jgi:CHASE2 domain-containing sensor protein
MLESADKTGAVEAKTDVETKTVKPRTKSRVWRRLVLVVMALIAAAAIAVSLIELSRHQLMLLTAPDRATYDWRTAFFSHQEATTRKDIALLLIGDRTMSQYNYELPIDRGLLAQIVHALDAAGAKVIGFDFIIDRPTDKDDLFIDAIRASRTPVVLGAIDSRLIGIAPENLAFQKSFFERAGNPPIGHLYFYRAQRSFGQPDQTIRFLPPHATQSDQIGRSFTEALLIASGRQVPDVGDLIAWTETRADNGAEAFDSFDIPAHKPQDLADDVVVRPEWRDRLKDKIVIVGSNFEDRDRHLTPMSVVDGARTQGVRIHAQILAQLIDKRSLQNLTDLQEFAIAFALAFIGILGGRHFRLQNYQFLVYAAGFLVLVAVGAWLFQSKSVILPSDTTFYSLIAGIAVGHYSQQILRRFGWFAKS